MTTPIIIILILSVACMTFVIGVMAFMTVKNARLYRKNKNAPSLTVEAKIVAMRDEFITAYSRRHGITCYFATFEQPNGDRIELSLEKADFDLLAIGDEGTLVFRGDRLISFEKNPR